MKLSKQIFPICYSDRERKWNQWNFATVVPRKFASPDFRYMLANALVLHPSLNPRTLRRVFSHVLGSKDPDLISENREGYRVPERSTRERRTERVRATPWNRVTRCCYINSAGSWCLSVPAVYAYILDRERAMPKINLTAFVSLMRSSAYSRRFVLYILAIPPVASRRVASFPCFSHTCEFTWISSASASFPFDLACSCKYIFIAPFHCFLFLFSFILFDLSLWILLPFPIFACIFCVLFANVYRLLRFCLRVVRHLCPFSSSLSSLLCCTVYRLLSGYFPCAANYSVNPSSIQYSEHRPNEISD